MLLHHSFGEGVIFISLQHFIAPALDLMPSLQAQGGVSVVYYDQRMHAQAWSKTMKNIQHVRGEKRRCKVNLLIIEYNFFGTLSVNYPTYTYFVCSVQYLLTVVNTIRMTCNPP